MGPALLQCSWRLRECGQVPRRRRGGAIPKSGRGRTAAQMGEALEVVDSRDRGAGRNLACGGGGPRTWLVFGNCFQTREIIRRRKTLGFCDQTALVVFVLKPVVIDCHFVLGSLCGGEPLRPIASYKGYFPKNLERRCLVGRPES